MWIIWTIIIGLLAGIVAKLLMPGRDPGGFIITTLLGIAGAFVATFIGRAVGWYGEAEGAQFIGAVIGGASPTVSRPRAGPIRLRTPRSPGMYTARMSPPSTRC